MKIHSNARIAAVLAVLFASAGAQAELSWHPVIVTMDVKNCTTNKAQTSSVKLTTQGRTSPATVRFAFRNMVTSQVQKFDHPDNLANHEFTLPGGIYSLKVSYINTPAGDVFPGSVQLIYEPIPVPSIVSGGKCVPSSAILGKIG
jgi:hypothetical protein